MAQVKYYSFTDPVTGAVTKNYGYSTPRISTSAVVKLIRGEAKVLKNESVEVTDDRVPKGENLVELTKEEFDALDVSNESLLSKLHRERNILKNKKLEKQEIQALVSVSDEKLITAITSLAAK